MYQFLYIYNLPGAGLPMVERDFFNNLYSNLKRCMLLSVLQVISLRLEVVSFVMPRSHSLGCHWLVLLGLKKPSFQL